MDKRGINLLAKEKKERQEVLYFIKTSLITLLISIILSFALLFALIKYSDFLENRANSNEKLILSPEYEQSNMIDEELNNIKTYNELLTDTKDNIYVENIDCASYLAQLKIYAGDIITYENIQYSENNLIVTARAKDVSDAVKYINNIPNVDSNLFSAFDNMIIKGINDTSDFFEFTLHFIIQ